MGDERDDPGDAPGGGRVAARESARVKASRSTVMVMVMGYWGMG
jgi:hypothetical protein